MGKPRLTKAKVKDLLRRELGASAQTLATLERKTENPEFPIFVADCGNTNVTVSMFQTGQGYKMVALWLRFFDETSHTLYFYADTLEPCESYGLAQRWDGVREAAEGRDLDRTAWTAQCEADRDLRQHYGRM